MNADNTEEDQSSQAPVGAYRNRIYADSIKCSSHRYIGLRKIHN